MPCANFNPWGMPTMAAMLLLTGVDHCKFKLIHRNMNMYALVFAYFKAITKNKTPKEIAEDKGEKVFRMNWSRPLYTNPDFSNML
jgi:hypothetical protein